MNREALIQNTSSPFADFPVANFYGGFGQYNDIFANGDGQYLYPCENGKPCGSIRLSALRDGLEDWELFSRHGDHDDKMLWIESETVRSAFEIGNSPLTNI